MNLHKQARLTPRGRFSYSAGSMADVAGGQPCFLRPTPAASMCRSSSCRWPWADLLWVLDHFSAPPRIVDRLLCLALLVPARQDVCWGTPIRSLSPIRRRGHECWFAAVLRTGNGLRRSLAGSCWPSATRTLGLRLPRRFARPPSQPGFVSFGFVLLGRSQWPAAPILPDLSRQAAQTRRGG